MGTCVGKEGSEDSVVYWMILIEWLNLMFGLPFFFTATIIFISKYGFGLMLLLDQN